MVKVNICVDNETYMRFKHMYKVSLSRFIDEFIMKHNFNIEEITMILRDIKIEHGYRKCTSVSLSHCTLYFIKLIAVKLGTNASDVILRIIEYAVTHTE